MFRRSRAAAYAASIASAAHRTTEFVTKGSSMKNWSVESISGPAPRARPASASRPASTIRSTRSRLSAPVRGVGSSGPGCPAGAPLRVSAKTTPITSVITPSSTIAPQRTSAMLASPSHRSTVRSVSAKMSITTIAATDTRCAARTIFTTPRRPRTLPAAYRHARPSTVTFTTEFETNGSSRKKPPMKPPAR